MQRATSKQSNAKKPARRNGHAEANPVAEPDALRIDWLSLPDLLARLEPENPRKHDLARLKDSIRANGFVAPPLLNEKTGRLVFGHGRALALQDLHRSDPEKPPARIRVDAKGWLVPVLRGLSFETQDDALRYLLADNRVAEFSTWELPDLGAMLSRLQTSDHIVGSGWSDREIDRLLAQLRGTEALADDEVPEPPKVPVTKLGDLWTLGDHVILCGDSTKPEDVARLMGDERAVLMNTDPPYGVNYGDIANSRLRAADKKNGRPPYVSIENDDLDGAGLQAFLESAIRSALPHLTAAPAFYLWHPMPTQGTFFAAAAAAADILIHRQIIWVKPSLIMGRGDYHWRHELCSYGWIKGKRCAWYGDRAQDTIWEIGRENDKIHPTQKPLELFAIPIRNHTRPGEVCYEPFSGSGTQIIAAEQLGRRCRALEIAPAYVDVAVQRWERLTGKKAECQKRF